MLLLVGFFCLGSSLLPLLLLLMPFRFDFAWLKYPIRKWNWIGLKCFFLGCFVVGNRQYMNRLQCSLSLLAFCDTLTYKINKSHLLPALPFTAFKWVSGERVTNGNEKLYFPWICFRWIIINYHPAQLCLKGFFLSGEAISLPSRSHLRGIVVLGLPLFTLFPCNFLLALFVSFSAVYSLSHQTELSTIINVKRIQMNKQERITVWFWNARK